jgi:hypothetical protein
MGATLAPDDSAGAISLPLAGKKLRGKDLARSASARLAAYFCQLLALGWGQ